MSDSKKLVLYSPTLGKEVELESNGLMGPKHSALESIFYDVLVPEFNARIETRWIVANLDHSVVETTIECDTEKLRRRIITNGESTKNTLLSEISANNPSTLAFNRAFDRAVLKFLGLYCVYAASEDVSQENLYSAPATAPVPAPIPTPVIPDHKETQTTSDTGTVIIMNEEEEFKTLLKSICYLRKYPNKNGESKFAPFGYLLKNKPEDLKHLAAANASFDLEALKVTDPQKAQSLSELYRLLELNNKFKVINQ